MHLLSPYLLLLSFGVLPGNASPAGLPILPNLPSNPSGFLMPSNTSGLTEWPFVDRPKNMENYINDYMVKVGSQHPDSGQGDPQEITKVLAAISEWYPSQKNPDGKYPSTIKYEATVDQVKYTFTAEEYRGYLDDQSLPVIIEACRRYAVYSKSAKLPTLHWLAFWDISFWAFGELTWEGAVP